jgi:hypothetical protein
VPYKLVDPPLSWLRIRLTHINSNDVAPSFVSSYLISFSKNTRVRHSQLYNYSSSGNMKFISALVTLATCTTTVVANDGGSLVQRGLEYCAIVNAPNGVHCRVAPSLSGQVSYVFQNGATDAYTCFVYGDCYEGNWYVSRSSIFGYLTKIYC